jgi:hypothetical protein
MAATFGATADPSEFVRDKDEFRHGTHDRIWKPKTVYVDQDGTLLLPFSDDVLLAANREWIERILVIYSGDRRKKLQFRVYIHPKARWSDIHEFVEWITKQEIGSLVLRCAEMRDSDAKKQDDKSKKPNKAAHANPLPAPSRKVNENSNH